MWKAREIVQGEGVYFACGQPQFYPWLPPGMTPEHRGWGKTWTPRCDCQTKQKEWIFILVFNVILFVSQW